VLYGAANILISGLVLVGAITPAGSVNENSLRWPLFFWDLWFLTWGAILAVAVARYRRRTS
jgi:hypothetical protein